MCSQQLDLRSTSMPRKKFESLDARARNPKHFKNEPHFAPVKDFLILTLHIPRETLY